jgi:hypothetical protein
VTSRALIRWSELHERRARTVHPMVMPIVVGGVLAAWVWWRSNAGILAASHAWLAGALVAFTVAFLRVPFHIYWRGDASLLAQLPIEGRALFDAAMLRCLRAAEVMTIAATIGIAPIAVTGGWELALHHAAAAVALGAAAALLVPGVTIAGAALVVQGGGERVLRTAMTAGGATARAAPAPGATTPSPASTSPAAILGMIPGLAAAIVLVAILVIAPWLYGEAPRAPVWLVLGGLVAASLAAAAAARAGAAIMGRILRDVSALDRQRLAALDVRPPTLIERLIARLVGDARLAYDKDARLMRRRFPMAYALGGIAFVVLAIVGLARPDDATPWLAAAIGGAASYGLVLAARLRRPPIEIARLSATLPLPPRALLRAKLAWLLGWWSVFIVVPAVFAALRQPEPVSGLALTVGATIAIIVAGALPR